MDGVADFDGEKFEFSGSDERYENLKSVFDAFVLKFGVDEDENVSQLKKCFVNINVDSSRVTYNFFIPEKRLEDARSKLRELSGVEWSEV